MELGFLITAYNNWQQTLDNIRHIRSIPKFENSTICVVSTAYEENIVNAFNCFTYRLKIQPTIVKVIEDAPGNPKSTWGPPNQQYISWRHKWLPPRILKSLDVGFELLRNVGVDTCLHLHSDSFIQRDYVPQLIEEANQVYESYGAIWDLCMEDCLGPFNSHPHPESILADIHFFNHMGILPFSNCYTDSNFVHWNWASTESLVANWIHYKITGKYLKQDSISDPKYNTMFRVRCKRDYHGTFDHLINLPGTQ